MNANLRYSAGQTQLYIEAEQIRESAKAILVREFNPYGAREREWWIPKSLVERRELAGITLLWVEAWFVHKNNIPY
jgi:hypothetical protein